MSGLKLRQKKLVMRNCIIVATLVLTAVAVPASTAGAARARTRDLGRLPAGPLLPVDYPVAGLVRGDVHEEWPAPYDACPGYHLPERVLWGTQRTFEPSDAAAWAPNELNNELQAPAEQEEQPGALELVPPSGDEPEREPAREPDSAADGPVLEEADGPVLEGANGPAFDKSDGPELEAADGHARWPEQTAISNQLFQANDLPTGLGRATPFGE